MEGVGSLYSGLVLTCIRAGHDCYAMSCLLQKALKEYEKKESLEKANSVCSGISVELLGSTQATH